MFITPLYLKPKRTQFYWIAFFYLVSSVLHAEIVTDGTAGSAQALTGPDFTISEDLGTRAGDNLFHSFDQFNIAPGEQATFTGSPTITNVISRVTGGETSTINGLLRSEVGQADFYFINPAGVVFGAGTQVDVPASFYVSTADELHFPDSSIYSTKDLSASSWSIGQPESFGFLGDQTATISIAETSLILTPKHTLSFSGGELHIDDTKLIAQQGEIQLIATGNNSTIVTVDGDLSGSDRGNMHINNSDIIVSGYGAGRIVIQSGDSTISSSKLFADNVGSTDAHFQGIYIQSESLHLVDSLISTDTFNEGLQAANLAVDVTNHLSIVAGGEIRSITFTRGDTGTVTVQAESLTIDRQGHELFTGIRSQAGKNSIGNANDVMVFVTGDLNILNGGVISSRIAGLSQGNAGNVTVHANNLTLNRQNGEFLTLISSTAGRGSVGQAGDITVRVNDTLNVLNGASIDSPTFAQGDAGQVTVQASTLTIDDQGSNFFTGIGSQAERGSTGGNAGDVTISVADTLNIRHGGVISSDTFTVGNAGSVTVDTASLIIDGQDWKFPTGISSASQAERGSTGGNAGNVTISVANTLNIRQGGVISSSTFTTGSAGSVTVDTASLIIDGQASNLATGISSASMADNGSTGGNAGDVTISVADTLNIRPGGVIRSDTFTAGNAGSVTVDTTSLIIDGQGLKFPTGISSDAQGIGNAGDVVVLVTDTAEILNRGVIASRTIASENKPGKVTIEAGNLTLNGQGSPFVTGISTATFSDSDAGDIDVSVADTLHVLNSAEISSATQSEGDAGDIKIQANNISVDGQNNEFHTLIVSNAQRGSSGHAGNLEISAASTLNIFNGGQINTSTLSEGNAGNITVRVGNLTINRQSSEIETSITSSAQPHATGNGGNVTVFVADSLQLINGGEIDISNFSFGTAGTLNVSSNQLLIDGYNSDFFTGINSVAEASSSGQSGTVSIIANDILLTRGGQVSIESLPTVESTLLTAPQPTEINIDARTVILDNSSITAQSFGNIPAGSINLNDIDTLSLNSSTISTAANNANGGAIITTADVIDLKNSRITTSVRVDGDGGDIALNSDVVILDTGFIRASTEGRNNAGGNIKINTEALITSRNNLQVGGNTSSNFEPNSGVNLIQAAAPRRLNDGDINITSPQLNISGDLASLESDLLDINQLAQNPCIVPGAKQSTLVSLGQGGLPESPEQAGNIALDAERLQQLLPHLQPISNASSGTPNPQQAQQLAWQAITECQP